MVSMFIVIPEPDKAMFVIPVALVLSVLLGLGGAIQEYKN
jgi:hypothetical protein